MRKIVLLAAILTQSFIGFSQLQSPEDFLGYKLGDRYTYHYRVVDYFNYVASALPTVEVRQYGETFEHRPLIYTVIASQENFNNLETIRLDNLRRAGMADGSPSTNVAIVWLSYNVHGDEANSMEAAMQTLYDLADPNNTKSKEWLKNTVVIIDPCINPDGRDRYANFYRQYGNNPPNPDPNAYEHEQSWPRGRTNHYLFDLNRDWAWLSQVESKARIKVYNEWLPHVHVDFHEQGYNSPYYFAPAAEPYHGVITPWQREFQRMIGKNHAKYFDREGWLYFTKEVFDLYYPSYGDTYPVFNGSIGMTYEQAGNAGVTITTKEGDPLTLKDRLTHHYTTGMSTVEVSSQNADRLVTEFAKYYRDNISNPSSTYKTYVVSASNHPDKVKRLLALLDKHGVRYGHASSGKSVRGLDYYTRTTQSVNVSTNDIIISAYQPKSRFLTTLFEPQSKLPDSLTYDITAWNLMYAYGLKGYALTDRINVGKNYVASTPEYKLDEKPYAYMIKYESLDDAEFLGSLLQAGVNVRVARKPFTVAQQSFASGTLIVTRKNNEHVEGFDELVRSMAKAKDKRLYSTTTGLVDEGKDFGSSYVDYVKAPKIATLIGEQTSSNSVGQIWYFFEQELHYPITQLGTTSFSARDLESYDVFVVPEGRYRFFNESTLNDIKSWVSAGGRLIILGSAVNSFADKEGYALKRYSTDEAKKAAEKKREELERKDVLIRYDDAERNYVSSSIYGAIYKVTLDDSHPLAFGLPEYYTLKTNASRFDYLTNGWNIGTLRGKVKPVQGFAGYRANLELENSLSFGVQDMGRGQVVYFVDNPLFRCFWENGKMLFANALFIVGSR